MATLIEVVYPSTTSYAGTAQLNLGPYEVPTVANLLRAEVRGQMNFQGSSIVDNTTITNPMIYGVQWVPFGDPANDVVTSADGPGWLMREVLGSTDYNTTWAPTTDTAALYGGNGMHADWAGQLPVNQSIYLYLSIKSPTGYSVVNSNVYATLRFWWTAT